MYRTIILPLVLYGCETWSLTLREEHRFRVFENRVLRRIFGPKRGEVTGGCRTLHNEELYGLYTSSDGDQIKEYKMGSARSVHGGDEKCVQSFGWKA
jgi:hypothetical protein